MNGDLFSAAAVKDLQGTHLYNNVLLAAIGRLSLFEDHRVRQRVNYGALDVEELGSVYESLLDYQPVITEQTEGMSFELPTGSERKSTGSYYTRPELVRELIESALVPVLQGRLAGAKDSDPSREKEKKQQAILSMSVCDPACGSGHFLLAAARRLGRELAKVRSGEDEPIPKEFHLAVRDVIAHCIYGVDVNPLAVDLCKLALWLEGHWTGKPLSFLDHRIKLGNSLIGVLDMNVMEEGIPEEAFNAVAGDDKKVAGAFKKKNRDERKGQPTLSFDSVEHVHQYAQESAQFVSLAEDTPADVRRKKELYEKARQRPDWWHDWVGANIWTAAFFVPLTTFDDPAVPTHSKFASYLRGGHVDGQLEGSATGFATDMRFFHWPLEFPAVFARRGFDVIIGNPPWEKIKLLEEEHWVDDDYISNAPTKAERSRRIEEYRTSTNSTKRERIARFDLAKHNHEAISKFVRNGARFPLTAVGDINTYALFAELARRLISSEGRTGVIVQSGIATDDTYKDFFGDLVRKESLVSLFDFVNLEGFFPGVHKTHPHFCALTLNGQKHTEPIKFSFYMTRTDQLLDQRRRFTLSAEELGQMNPNTHTCPVFRTRTDAQLVRKIYSHVPVLLDETHGKNPWDVEFRAMFHMSNDSELFHSAPAENLLALYEAKLLHQFDHRWATYEGEDSRYCTEAEKADPKFAVTPRFWVSEEEVVCRTTKVPTALITAYRLGDEKLCAQGLHYWLAGYFDLNRSDDKVADLFMNRLPVSIWQSGQGMLLDIIRNEATAKTMQRNWPLSYLDIALLTDCKSAVEAVRKLMWHRHPRWLLAFRDITNATNERTSIFTVVPWAGLGNNAPLLLSSVNDTALQSCLLGNVNSIVFDYVARQKVGGTHMNFFIVNQLPVLAPDHYTGDDVSYISGRVLKLVYTSENVVGFAESLAYEGKPFLFDPNRRTIIRAELDAYYAHLYSLTRHELRYVLDPTDIFGDDFPSETFRVLKEREQKKYGEYRTGRLVLEAFDKLAESPRFRDEMSQRESAITTPQRASAMTTVNTSRR